ncbi:FAD-binding oxidoreductase [Actinopolymorpha alba]|uniref:FAD-binding oxidoreductase n=1 Tax=Actinopolymorpha alba TaxID=533267 RepID=UPI0009FD6E7E|nr:FAD-binding oxidoreductase [Actinopolymorpha alba]
MDELAHAGLGARPFSRWAGREHDVVPSNRVLVWLAQRLGELTPQPAVPVSVIPVPPSGLPRAAAEALRDAVGGEYVDEDPTARLAHAGGQSYSDLLRRRLGHHVVVPDAIVWPATHDEVAAILAVASDHGIAVIPYGGGTSVVGGVEPQRGQHEAVVTLDLSRMDRLLAVDEVSRTATFQPGVTGPRAEALLTGSRLTVGHVPQSFERATLGGYVATRSAGQASTGYGRIDDMVVALRVATPVGELRLGTGTPNAAGPDLRALFTGSEGTLGVLTELTLRVRPVPAARKYEMWAFPAFERGLDVIRMLVQDGMVPDVIRLSDEEETEATLALQGAKGRAAGLFARMRGARTPAFCVLGWEGSADAVRRRRRLVLPALQKSGAVWIGGRAGEAWRRHRFSGPHQRDALLDAGLLVETVETATSWSRLRELYAAVRRALRDTLASHGTPSLVLCHVSHIYPTGASLYFTVLARQLPGAEAAVEQWERAKAAANAAITAAGATISHHHAVGRAHAPYLEAEVGVAGVAVLSAVKSALDPRGILNPGALIPPPIPAQRTHASVRP